MNGMIVWGFVAGSFVFARIAGFCMDRDVEQGMRRGVPKKRYEFVGIGSALTSAVCIVLAGYFTLVSFARADDGGPDVDDVRAEVVEFLEEDR